MKNDKDKPTPKKSEGKVFDVRRPGKAPASPTSRPVIMGHKPEAQSAQTSVSGVGEASPMLTKRKIQIMPGGAGINTEERSSGEAPIDQAETTQQASPPPRATEQEEKALAATALDAVAGPPELGKESEKLLTGPKLRIEPPASESDPEPKPASAEPDQEKPEPQEEQTAEPAPSAEAEKSAVATSVDGQEGDNQETAAPEIEIQQPEVEIKPLFDDSGAIVVSNHERRRRHHGVAVFFVILLILALTIAGLDIVLDLGLIDLQGVPRTNLL